MHFVSNLFFFFAYTYSWLCFTFSRFLIYYSQLPAKFPSLPKSFFPLSVFPLSILPHSLNPSFPCSLSLHLPLVQSPLSGQLLLKPLCYFAPTETPTHHYPGSPPAPTPHQSAPALSSVKSTFGAFAVHRLLPSECVFLLLLFFWHACSRPSIYVHLCMMIF